MNLLELSEQEIIRRNSMEQLRQMGIEPYPAAEYVTNAFSKEIKENFKDDAEPRPVSIAGRIMSRRIMGKASFMELQDSEGRIQVYISRDDICPEENKDLYNIVFKKLLDIGDFVGIKGFVFRTQMGEISVHAQEITVLSKSLKPLPVVKYKDGVAYDGFNDPELRYRQRYVDLVVNDGVKDIFMKRAAVIGALKRLELIRNHPEYQQKLWEIVRVLQSSLKENGFEIGVTNSPVTPVFLKGGIPEATNLVVDLRENHGIFCSMVVYPVIPKGEIILRIIPTAVHTLEDVNVTIEAFKAVRSKLQDGIYAKLPIPVRADEGFLVR